MQNPKSDKIIANTMMHLIQTATNKGLVSDQERILLDEFDQSLNYFGSELDRILFNEQITKENELYLYQLKDLIIENGFNLANEINGVSTELMNLIVSVIINLKVPKANII